jgi:hypothetical protein
VSGPGQIPDGLLALQSKREAAKRQPSGLKRTIRPSQHPNTLPPYEASEVIDVRETAEQPTAAWEPVAPAPREKRALPKKDDRPVPIVRVTSYVDESQDAYLDDVKFVGVHRRTKIDVSRAAVMRFALERLMADMTPEQAYEAIPLNRSIPTGQDASVGEQRYDAITPRSTSRLASGPTRQSGFASRKRDQHATSPLRWRCSSSAQRASGLSVSTGDWRRPP